MTKLGQGKKYKNKIQFEINKVIIIIVNMRAL